MSDNLRVGHVLAMMQAAGLMDAGRELTGIRDEVHLKPLKKPERILSLTEKLRSLSGYLTQRSRNMKEGKRREFLSYAGSCDDARCLLDGMIRLLDVSQDVIVTQREQIETLMKKSIGDET